MHHSKTLRLLQTLDAVELKRLLLFLKSPFYNANPRIVQLYLLLRAHHPDFNSPKLAKEKVFQKLFPERAYDHKKLLNLMSDFTALLKKYLQVLQLEQDAVLEQQLLIKAYGERPHGYEFFKRQIEKTDEILDARPFRDADFYRQKFQLRQQYLNHPATDKFQLSKAQ